MFKNQSVGSCFFINKTKPLGMKDSAWVCTVCCPRKLAWSSSGTAGQSLCQHRACSSVLTVWVDVLLQCFRGRNFVIDVFHSFSFSVGSVCWLSCISPAFRRMHECWKDSLSCIMKEEKFQGRNLLATVSIPALYLALQAPTASEW